MNLVIIILGVVSYSALVNCISPCSGLKTCKECIGYASERCVWCGMDMMNSSLPETLSARCQPRAKVYKGDQLNTKWCPLSEINDPDSTKPIVIEDKPFNAKKGEIIQFRPQKIELTLRPGVPETIDMFYRPAEQFPLDMYFLMDSSYTMQSYSSEIAKQTMNIFDALVKLTNNVHMGIGSFVDKAALPYANPSVHKNCHAFQHHLSLTDNMTLFKDKIKSYHVDTDANYDSPESGLDALMQVMKCGDKIGWRTKSKTGAVDARRIIIIATDATYHSAGDGKMVGAYKPNDMECHLDAHAKYDDKWSLTLDYPSVGQINYVAKENKVSIVFAVLNHVVDTYKALADKIIGAKCVELQGERVIEIIRNAYITASRGVKLDNKAPKSIKIETNCDKPNQCKSTEENPVVHIIANITAMDCDSGANFEINPFGISDKLSIKVKINCKCPCEEKPTIRNSVDCSSAGKKRCGICECNKDRSGDKCETECSGKQFAETMNQCKERPNDDILCNGEGDCVCGKCKCKNKNGKSFSGTFCEHNDALCRVTCPVEKGDCELGACICKDPTKWVGPYCNCPVSKKACVGPFSEEVCSGRGACDCGKCKCKPKDGKEYFGNYCESCNDCAKELCEQLKDYAYCNYEKTPKADCDKRFNKTSVKEVILMNRTALEAETAVTGCRKKLSDGKIIVYKYRIVIDEDTETAQLKLMIQDELESPPVANIWITIGSVIGGVLLVGLLTLIIWKVLTNMYDKKEYDRFCQEAASAGFDVSNPVYQDPSVNFVNPAYKGDTNTCPAN